jgi:hypothetical protein
LFSNNLSNDILCAHHVFLSYSNLWYLIMRWYYILYFYKALHTFFFIFFRKLFLRLGGPEAIDFFQSFQKANYHFADVNSARNFIINRAENMFNSTGYLVCQ